MNRNRPPMPLPSPGFQDSPFAGRGDPRQEVYPQQQPRYAQPQEAVGIYSPSRTLMALIRLSEKLYPFFGDALTRFEGGTSELGMDSQNLGIALANRGETQALEPFSMADEIMRIEAAKHRAIIDAAMRSELAWQGNCKRWVSGQMPIASAPSAYASAVPRGYPPPLQPQQPDGRGYSPLQPQQGFAPPPPGAQQRAPMPPPPPMPPGGVDYSDPRQAAEALLRAASMPMVPQQGQQQMQPPQPPPMPYPYPQQQMPPQPMPQQQVMPQQQMVAGQVMPQPTLVPTSMQYQHEVPPQAQPQSTNGAAKSS